MSILKDLLVIVLVGLIPWPAFADAGASGKALDIYFIDTEGGAATLIVTPMGESVLVDAGNPGERDAGRIARVAKEVAKLVQIDHMITTHWHIDHVGGVPHLGELIPIKKFLDSGVPDEPRPDIRPQDLEAYRKATGGKSTVLKPGDEVPLRSDGESKAVKILVVAAGGRVLGEEPVVGTRQEPPCAKKHEARAIDKSDNARSVAFVLSFGSFRFFDGGDLTWNIEHRLVCPKNLPGEVDVFQVNHHGLDQSNNPALVEALRPRIAIINNGPRKGGEPRTFATLKAAKDLEAIFQLHRNIRTGEKDNSPPDFIANDEERCQGEFIKLSVDPAGSAYTVAVPSKGTTRRYETRP
ncbi:MAG TPA: MBL fold metallo-hydrolase [Planctomycetota bacterium]|nr:MBL fold metallo-hydrolase [Planctomycetota bacterium]